MASKAEVRALTIVSVAQGAIRVLLAEKRFSRIDMSEKLKVLNDMCGILYTTYSNNYTEGEEARQLVKMLRWHEAVNELGVDESLRSIVLVNVALMGLSDILCKLKNPGRIRDIQQLIISLDEFSKFLDPEGRRFSGYEQAGDILKLLYEEIGTP